MASFSKPLERVRGGEKVWGECEGKGKGRGSQVGAYVTHRHATRSSRTPNTPPLSGGRPSSETSSLPHPLSLPLSFLPSFLHHGRVTIRISPCTVVCALFDFEKGIGWEYKYRSLTHTHTCIHAHMHSVHIYKRRRGGREEGKEGSSGFRRIDNFVTVCFLTLPPPPSPPLPFHPFSVPPPLPRAPLPFFLPASHSHFPFRALKSILRSISLFS